MDNLCHTLAGAAFGETGLKRRTRFASPVLIIASNLPDIDVLAYVTDMPAVAFRRGWTHGVLAQALLPLMLTGIFVAIDRYHPRRDATPPTRVGPLLALSYLGVIVHVVMDWLNTYGVRLLMPFSGRWFYGDAVFIVDPWLWLTLAAGVFLARRRGTVTPARIAVTIATAYVIGMVWAARAAREIVLEAWTAQHGTAPQALMVGPAPIDPSRRIVIVDAGDRYENGTFRWRGQQVSFESPAIPAHEDHPAVARAREHPTIRSILVWARFPYYEVADTPGGTRVTLRDMRFGARMGSVSVTVSSE
jgi:inner membrane protein